MPDSALTRLATAVLDVPTPERALVCGCGDGEPVLFLAREFPSARVRGTDPSAERVRAASARVGLDPEGRVAFKQSTPRRLPFPDEFFDLVAIFEGRPAPREIARVMRPEARLIVASSPPAGPLGVLRQRLWQRRLPQADI
ncbi:MAG TPA: class I SAM-dependent methyltransferase [Solirubrobacterales bacterium]|nr:class I SAM-dependent methyltransferase [Solirubrobacterales bacterium]